MNLGINKNIKDENKQSGLEIIKYLTSENFKEI